MKYEHPKETTNWGNFNTKHLRFSLGWLVKNIVYGILDPEIKLCCLLHYSVSLFLTGKAQARQRGIIMVEKYKIKQRTIYSAYVPCFLCLRRMKSEK